MYMDNIKQFAQNENSPEIFIWTMRKYSQDIFRREKCGMLIKKSRKIEITEGIELRNQEWIWMIGEKENYKNLGVLEASTIKQAEIFENKKSIHEKIQLYNRNLIKGIKIWTVSF